MDHIVYVSYKEKDLENFEKGIKTIILKSAMGRKIPYGKVNIGDILYFINNNGEGTINSKAKVKSVFFSEKLTKDETMKILDENKEKIHLSSDMYKIVISKRYITLIEIENYEKIDKIIFNKTDYKNMDDWIIIENFNQNTK